MRIWFDTEFIEDGKTIDLLSIGMVREDGQMYYAESSDCDRSRASDWVVQNVFPHLTGRILSRNQIKHDVLEFAGVQPELWAYFADYDWVVLCQLYGTMMDLPGGWPMFCMDLQQERMRKGIKELPKLEGNAHNALDDALWCRQAWEYVMQQPERSA